MNMLILERGQVVPTCGHAMYALHGHIHTPYGGYANEKDYMVGRSQNRRNKMPLLATGIECLPIKYTNISENVIGLSTS